jgi:hypothetical protein
MKSHSSPTFKKRRASYHERRTRKLSMNKQKRMSESSQKTVRFRKSKSQEEIPDKLPTGSKKIDIELLKKESVPRPLSTSEKYQVFRNQFSWEAIRCQFEDGSEHVFRLSSARTPLTHDFKKRFKEEFSKISGKKDTNIAQFLFTDVFAREYTLDRKTRACKIYVQNLLHEETINFYIPFLLANDLYNPAPCLYVMGMTDNRQFYMGIAIDSHSIRYLTWDGFKNTIYRERTSKPIIFCMYKDCDPTESLTSITCECKSAFYCCPKHKKLDWEAGHSKVCKK